MIKLVVPRLEHASEPQNHRSILLGSKHEIVRCVRHLFDWFILQICIIETDFWYLDKKEIEHCRFFLLQNGTLLSVEWTHWELIFDV